MDNDINKSIKEKIVKNNTYTGSYKNIIVTEPIANHRNDLEFRLLYNLMGSSFLFIYLKEKDGLKLKISNELNISSPDNPIKPADLEKLDENNTIIVLLDNLITSNLANPKTYTGIEAEAEEIRKDLISNLKDLATDEKERLSIINNITEEEILNELKVLTELNTEIIKDEDVKQLKDNIKGVTSHKKSQVQQELGDFLNREYGLILRANSHELYMLNQSGTAYESIEADEIIVMLAELFKEKNLVQTKFLDNSIEFISDRLHPQTNIIKFENGVYSLKEHRLFTPEEPVFTLMECPVKYNPEAKSVHLKKFLETSLKQPTKEETEMYILGVKQLIGYLFTSGNDRTILPVITGVSGAGKSIFCSILEKLVNDKICNVPLQDLNKDHLTSALVGNQLNIIYDSGNEPIRDNGKIKQITSDSIGINPKGLKPYTLPAKEVPKTILVCNETPIFINPEIAILERLVFIEFKHKFRGTGNEDKDMKIKILNNEEELEWFVYECLEAYKQMVINNQNFILQKNTDKTLKLLNKHSKPLNYLISELILKYDEEAYETEEKECRTEEEKEDLRVITSDLNNIIVYLAKKEGLELKLDKTGLVSPRKLLQVIKNELEIEDSKENKYTTESKPFNSLGKNLRIYPNLIKTSLYDTTLEEMKNTDWEYIDR